MCTLHGLMRGIHLYRHWHLRSWEHDHHLAYTPTRLHAVRPAMPFTARGRLSNRSRRTYPMRKPWSCKMRSTKVTLAPVYVLNSTVSLSFAYACTWNASSTFSHIRPFASSASSALAVPGFLRPRRVRRVFALSAPVMARRVYALSLPSHVAVCAASTFQYGGRASVGYVCWACCLLAVGFLHHRRSHHHWSCYCPRIWSRHPMSKHSSDHTRLLAPYLQNRINSPDLPL
jgi:hypothetical protein